MPILLVRVLPAPMTSTSATPTAPIATADQAVATIVPLANFSSASIRKPIAKTHPFYFIE